MMLVASRHSYYWLALRNSLHLTLKEDAKAHELHDLLRFEGEGLDRVPFWEEEKAPDRGVAKSQSGFTVFRDTDAATVPRLTSLPCCAAQQSSCQGTLCNKVVSFERPRL